CQRSSSVAMKRAVKKTWEILFGNLLPDCECKGTPTFRIDKMFLKIFSGSERFCLLFDKNAHFKGILKLK
ncbi:MAG: hypothetical protein KBT29_10795, partial [Prevotellaceae bacterium]|nr:hypothetical protein [Candidatus Minthosoma caballi]